MEDDKGPAIACVYAMHGLLTINAGQLAVEGGEVRVYFDIRYPVTASGETVLARMRAAAAPYEVGRAATRERGRSPRRTYPP